MTEPENPTQDIPSTLRTLAGYARAIVTSDDTDAKVALSHAAAKAWLGRSLTLANFADRSDMPDRPGRPPRPQLLPPRQMPRRSTSGLEGRIALLHALAHIELNAVDMTWDLIGRFHQADVPRAFFDGWVQVGMEEAKHFALVRDRLRELGAAYGDLPAHDGLWRSAQETGHDLLARVAIVPLVLEARGLDVQPAMLANLRRHDDEPSAKILEIIYRDEKRHVAVGARWFRYLCERAALPVEATFHALVRKHFRSPLKPPFNDPARAEAGLTPGFYKPLVSTAYVP